MIVKNHTEKEHIIKLSKNQIDIINTLTSNINMQYIYRQEVEDAWEVQMTINGIVVYEVTDYSLETLPSNEIKDLIYYLIRLSGIKVEL